MMAAMATVTAEGDGSGEATVAEAVDPPTEPAIPTEAQRDVAEQLRSVVESMQPREQGMLRYYRSEGPAKPLDAHFAGGGKGDRTKAYAHNRTLRTHGFVEHVGRGHYEYRLADLVAEECAETPDDAVLDALVTDIETAFVKE